MIGDRKGRLAPGHDADMVILKEEPHKFDPSNSQSAVTWSSFDGRRFNVKVAATYCRGELVWDGSGIKNQAGGAARFVRPTLSNAHRAHESAVNTDSIRDELDEVITLNSVSIIVAEYIPGY